MIISHRTPPYMPQHNGVSERSNRTLLYMVCSMMSQTTLPKSFWDYALESVAHILNMVSTKKVDKTPYEVWHGQAPKLPYLKVWGCEVLVKHDTLTSPEKLEPNLSTSGSLEDLEIIQEDDTYPSIDTSLHHDQDDQEINEPQSDINPIRKSTRTRNTPDQMCLHVDAEEHELGDLGEPSNYKASLLDPESEKWLNAINVDAIHERPRNVKSYFGRCFAMKDLGEAAYILGIKIHRDIGLCQSAYIEKILKRYFNENSRRETIPMQEKIKLSKSQGASTPAEKHHMQNVPYASTVGSIIGDMKRELRVSCYTDADDLKSQTGYVFVLNGGAVAWKSTKQSIFATSSTDAEYIAAFDASKEAVWIQLRSREVKVKLWSEEKL
nr:hypothetical protein [Tanacetum cinerariifolium]